MARFDKVDPKAGSFRARLGWQPVVGEIGDVIAVSLDASGRAVKAASAAASKGVVCMDELLAQGDVVDVMTHGEIVDVAAGDNVTGAAAGADVFAAAGGGLNVTAPGAGVNGVHVGHFVEAWRLVVRVQKVQG